MQWGRSRGVSLPKDLLDSVNLTDDDTVEITVADNSIIITKAKQRRKRETIEEIFADYDGGYFNTKELDWGEPQGEEVW
jgi:antitoxin component of MazEF toxin-antitoxin module